MTSTEDKVRVDENTRDDELDEVFDATPTRSSKTLTASVTIHMPWYRKPLLWIVYWRTKRWLKKQIALNKLKDNDGLQRTK